jgi:antitoxin ParD1/3/4
LPRIEKPTTDMTSLNISLPENIKDCVEQRVIQSGYGSVDESFLALIQPDQQYRAQEQLDSLLLEGPESLEQGNGIETTDEWWEQERDRLSATSLRENL